MTTRSGASYKTTESTMAEGGLALAEILKALLEDRQIREKEVAEERARREEELKRREEERLEERARRDEELKRREEELLEERAKREEELREERRRRDEETARREEEMSQQMKLLKGLVEGVQRQGDTAALKLERDRDVKVAKLTEDDDIEAYLTTFERLMKAYEIREERWAFKLASQLVGKAQQAYAAMNPEDAKDYAQLKKAILRRYDINEESYRQRFRSISRKQGETNRELAARLGDLAEKWMQGCETKEELKDLVILEQLVNTLPEDVRVWVKERKPKTSMEAGQLADDYIQARKQNSGEPSVPVSRKSANIPTHPPVRSCHRCGKPGHHARDCRTVFRPRDQERGRPDTSRTLERPKRDLKDIECFNCHKKGHYSSNCPHNAMFCGEKQIDPKGGSGKRTPGHEKTGVSKAGLVEGKAVDDILLDTGCSRTLVHRSLVPKEKLLEGEAVAIRCAHGDTVLYPLAQVEVEIEGQSFEIQAAVADRLPMAVLLGTDVPQLPELLSGELLGSETKIENALVVTRARARQQLEEAAEQQLREQRSGVQPTTLDRIGVTTEPEEVTTVQGNQEEETDIPVELRELDEELFEGGQERKKLTRNQKRENRKQYTPKNSEDQPPTRHTLDITAEELKTLQESDTTLEAIRKAAGGSPSTAGVGFFRRDDLVYRRWIPPGRDSEDMAVEQLVLPLQCRKTVLQLAHEIPLAGHLGKDKTASRILQRFYWPTLYRDVAEFCHSCGPCQKTSKYKTKRAPLMPLPIIDTPFQRMAMDIVGPLPRSRHGNRYILVMCDYATRYPEAVALRSIDAEHIAEELVKVFARVGIPEEILTDQGSNFTSQLLAELYRMLHVHPIRTSPYHPQTDGLVERFNKTLKSMLRKAAINEGKDWDKMLPYLLFAYREVPQASTGFSPFELLYGRAVNGPLDVLRKAWEVSKRSDESVVSHVLSMRDKMMKMTDLVQQNLSKAQEKQKLWYDKGARQREFTAGDQVLVLLPTSTSKLLAQWQGPYSVLKRVGRINYQVDMHDRRKRKRIFHVNMLRSWHAPEATGYYCEDFTDTDQDDVPVWNEGSESSGVEQPSFGEQLSAGQRAEVEALLEEHSDVMRNYPGRTMLAEHHIRTGDSRPVRLPPYRLPHAYRETVKKELQDMLQQGIIEPSSSEWSAPVVLVKKKDGSLRLCVDYRRLNGVSEMDAYPMPRIDDLIDRLGKSCFISTMDLTRGYWQVPVEKESRPKTAFATPFGFYQFNVMPFGLQGAPATFQRLMDKVVQGLEPFSAVYLDDLVIFSKTWEEHLQHVREVLQRLRSAGLTAKAKKCQFGMAQCVYLGHIVGSGLVRPDPVKIQAVKEFPVPHTKKQVRVFLGLAGYYRRFIPDYASIAAPLSDLTKKAAPTQVPWTANCEHAFQQLKQLLCATPVLQSPDFCKPFVLQTDASDRGVGAVLSQCDAAGQDYPVAYFSRKFLPREERYSTVEKECLAIKLAVQAFKVYLLGRPFQIQTDHRSLVWLDRLKENNPRLTRWSLSLQPYQFSVCHRSGRANGNADALSRATSN